MDAKLAAACRHAGVPPSPIVEKVSALIEAIGSDRDFLATKGLSIDEYRSALPMALEAMRGSQSASNSEHRLFLMSIFDLLVERGLIEQYETPAYGADTVYRLHTQDCGDVAIIQKGCPDGAHSSVRWSRPEWARETYLWWLCSSLAYEPGEHVSKGVNRLRQRFFGDAIDQLDGVIFHNQLCGTPQRPCPKLSRGIVVSERVVPPPCIYTMPRRSQDVAEWNWSGTETLRFPNILLGLFGITPGEVPAYLGHVGFQRRGNSLRTTICSRFGAGRSTTFRN